MSDGFVFYLFFTVAIICFIIASNQENDKDKLKSERNLSKIEKLEARVSALENGY